MLTYIILFFLLIVLWLLSLLTNKYNCKVFATIIVFAVIGLRGVTVGADTLVYKNLYESNYIWGSNEFGYTWLTRVCNEAGISFSFFLVIAAVFCAICFYMFVSKYSEDYIYSLIIFVGLGNFTMFMTGLRQTIAISMITLALLAMMKNKWYFFFPLVLLASTFHYSAIVILPIYLLKFIKWNRKSILAIAISVWSVLLLFGNAIFAALNTYFPEQYADSLISAAGKYSSNFLVIAIEVLIFAFCWFCLSYKNDNDNDNIWNILLVFQVLTVGLQLQAQSSLQIGRIMYYFDVAKIVLIPKAITRVKKDEIFIIKLIILVLIIAKFFISVPGGYSKIDNYTFFFMNR